MKNGIDKIPDSMKDTYRKYCIETDNNISLDSVILSDVNRKKLDEFLTDMKHSDELLKYNLKPINRILMYGASGTGKTYLTTALSNYFDKPFLAVDIANALVAGIAPIAISEVFDIANEMGEAVIFLDECDAICRKRDAVSVNNDAVNTLFQMLDRLSPKCVFVSATNLYRDLDPAFVRRFNIKMEFDMPIGKDIDPAIEKFRNPNIKFIRDVEQQTKDIVLYQISALDRLSYYGIKDWVERAEKQAIIDGTYEVRESTIYDYLMQELRLDVCKDKLGKIYLHQHARGRFS
jgi:SpoVK/Ycf46/Vps4 family AAA+-type ATPase